MRLRACQEAGLKEVHIIQADKLTEKQQREFIIKDNVGFGEWDWDDLANEWDVDELEDWGLDLPVDFAVEELEAEEDDYIETDEVSTNIVRGDIIEIGRHRLMCGDSADTDDVEKLMKDQKAEMVFTDPPWNVNYGDVKKGNAMGYKPRTILNDSMSTDGFKDFMSNVFATMSIFSKKGCPTYVVMSAQEWGNLMLTLHENNYHWSSTIIWNKSHLVMSRKDYHTKYEPIWYGWLDGSPRLCPLKDRKQSDVWDVDRPTKSELHPTTKPIELINIALKNSSIKDNLILDLFLGSGSTMVAAHQLKRKCYGMELDPKYCQVIVDRMLKLDSALEVKINGKEYKNTNNG
jgi:DNA modification methylase